MYKKYLPIGSVCSLKDKENKFMIIGYYSAKFDGDLTVNDYSGCRYPEGLLIPNQIISFNHTDIEKVDFIGFKNQEQEKFMKKFNKIMGSKMDIETEEFSNILFDDSGVVIATSETDKNVSSYDQLTSNSVISVKDSLNVTNPFYKEYEPEKKKRKNNKNWDIFENVEFDDNGVVISTDIDSKKDLLLNKIEFDEDGTVISIGKEQLEEEDSDNIPPIGPGLPGYEENKYEFDEDGTLVSVNGNKEKKSTEEYEFDEDGTVISTGKKQSKKDSDNIPPIGPGLPGYEESKYEFDEDGTVISTGKKQQKEDLDNIPPIGPGLPGYEENKYEFDEDGTLISVNEKKTKKSTEEYEFDENGILVSEN